MLGLYKFNEDCYYGTLSGLFIDNIDKINRIIKENKSIYFGSCLGKYSDIEATLNNENLKLLSNDINLISEIIKNLGRDFTVGYNPISILEKQESEENSY